MRCLLEEKELNSQKGKSTKGWGNQKDQQRLCFCEDGCFAITPELSRWRRCVRSAATPVFITPFVEAIVKKEEVVQITSFALDNMREDRCRIEHKSENINDENGKYTGCLRS